MSDLSSDEETFVIELLLASLRQAAEGPSLSGRGTGKKVRPQRPLNSYIIQDFIRRFLYNFHVLHRHLHCNGFTLFTYCEPVNFTSCKYCLCLYVFR